ncbi:MAG TPA: ABC transporter substrate-binding protein [Candidatus Binataceae bacterium]|nr:ABC transporter substrate-binding protein [Candidatus Binataceae bacterium]
MKITIGLSLSLSGEYAAMGKQAEAALRVFVSDANGGETFRIGGERCEFGLECRDDGSDPARCAEIYRELCGDRRIGLILGPYSNRLARVAAPIAADAGRLFVNHGGAGEELYQRGNRLIVGVLTPAGDYMRGFIRMLATLKFWRKRVAIVAAKSDFARAVAAGAERAAGERAARRRGVRVRVKWNGTFDPHETPARLFPALRRNRINALLSAGPYEYDLAAMRAVAEAPLNIPVLGCVAAGVKRFRKNLGELAEGIVGPSQWEESLDLSPEVGPSPGEFARRIRAAGFEDPDYPAAQAYASAILASAAISMAGELDDAKIREAFSDLRTSTLFGEFAIDRVTGRQIGHSMLLVQWHNGNKVIIDPEAHAERGELEFPSGWRLLLAGAEMLKLSRHSDADEIDADEKDEDSN